MDHRRHHHHHHPHHSTDPHFEQFLKTSGCNPDSDSRSSIHPGNFNQPDEQIQYSFIISAYSNVYTRIRKLSLHWNHQLTKWMFPKMGVPLVIIHFNGIFHWKPSLIFGDIPILGAPRFSTLSEPCFAVAPGLGTSPQCTRPFQCYPGSDMDHFTISPHLPGEGC